MRSWRRRSARLLGAPLFAVGLIGGSPASGAGEPAADRIEVATESLRLVFSPSAAAPVVWRACHPSCAAADAGSGTSIRFTDVPSVRVTLDGSEPRPPAVAAVVTDTPSARVVTFTSEPMAGIRLVTSFEIARRGYEVSLDARVLGPQAAVLLRERRLRVTLETGRRWSPTATSGGLIVDNDVRRLLLEGDRVRPLGAGARGRLRLEGGQWIGFRDRFWTLIARGAEGASVDLPTGEPLAIILESAPGATSVRYTVYSGPLEYGALSRTDPELRHLLFSGLWSWLRALSVAALLLLNALTAVVGHPGPAIILLAVAVRLLLLPVTTLAQRLGRQGLLGMLIQLPVLIAVFDMLAESFTLSGASFLGITDLAQPDGLIPLPPALPGIGGRVNLLPFVMYGVSLTAALRYDSAALTPDQVRHQRQKLAGMAALFLIAFYTFPASMVLYWTSTNALLLAVRELSRFRARALPAPS